MPWILSSLLQMAIWEHISSLEILLHLRLMPRRLLMYSTHWSLGQALSQAVSLLMLLEVKTSLNQSPTRSTQLGGLPSTILHSGCKCLLVPNVDQNMKTDAMYLTSPYNRTSLSADVDQWNLITNVYGPGLDALVPGGMSSYLNEANPFDPNWKRVFYGDNYDRLLEIKDRYDPYSIFYGLTAVGSDRWELYKDGRLCKVPDQDC